jgi:hypothetical protein
MLTRLRQLRTIRVNYAAVAGFAAGVALCLVLAAVAGTVYNGGLSDRVGSQTVVYPNL